MRTQFIVASVVGLVGLVGLVMACDASAPPPAASAATATSAITAQPLELRLVVDQGGVEFPSAAGPVFHLDANAIVTQRDLVSATADGANVNVTLRPEVAATLEDVTGKNVGHKLAIVVDGKVASAPEIKTKILGGHVQISLTSPDDAKQLAAKLSAK